MFRLKKAAEFVVRRNREIRPEERCATAIPARRAVPAAALRAPCRIAMVGGVRRAILLFVKYPEPGKVKTRLAATLGMETAADIYRRLVAAVIAGLPDGDDLIVMFDPPEKRAQVAEWLHSLLAGRRADFIPQAEGDLGARLDRAFAEAFAQGFAKVAVIGSDCIELSPAVFSETWEALETRGAVLGPSTDGGYYLLALRQPCAALFRGIAWSTDEVRAQTVARAQTVGLAVHELAALPDIDTEADWLRARPKLSVES